MRILVTVTRTHFVFQLSWYVQVPAATENGFVKPSHNFQCIAKVSTSFGFSQSITHGSKNKQKEMQHKHIFKVLKGFHNFLIELPG